MSKSRKEPKYESILQKMHGLQESKAELDQMTKKALKKRAGSKARRLFKEKVKPNLTSKSKGPVAAMFYDGGVDRRLNPKRWRGALADEEAAQDKADADERKRDKKSWDRRVLEREEITNALKLKNLPEAPPDLELEEAPDLELEIKKKHEKRKKSLKNLKKKRSRGEWDTEGSKDVEGPVAAMPGSHKQNRMRY